MREGTIVDATIIAEPCSTKNARKERDPEMHQTRKGNQWYFGMKAHIGVDVRFGVVHSLSATAANVADIAQTHALLHGQEKTGYADAGYLGVEKREEIVTRAADVEWHVAAKRSTVKALPAGLVKDLTQQLEKLKAQVRARAEHPFHVIKNLFHHRKTRYRGLAKNLAQLYSLFALANLVIVRRPLLSAEAE
jgi:IS5 family transposase